MPNPAAPLTDAHDEFIELYNPNAVAFDLRNYTLETGTTTLHDFTFTDDLTIPGNSYEAFYSADTGLSLSNSGGEAKFLDPTGNTLSTTVTYDTAKDGQAWALATDNTWQWTTTPTPNAANIITQPIVAAAAPKTPAVPKPKATAAKTVKGTTTTKTAKPKAAKAPKKAAASTTSDASFSDTADVTTPIHPLVLAAVGGLAYYTACMNTAQTWATNSTSSGATEALAGKLAANCKGGEVIELASDLGGGKTTFVRGLARGLGSIDRVSSPTFKISNEYAVPPAPGRTLRTLIHFDFYRLSEAGVVAQELAEVLGDPTIVVVIEWSGVVQDVFASRAPNRDFRTNERRRPPTDL